MNSFTTSAFAQEKIAAGRQLLIKRIDAFPVALPLRKPITMSGGSLAHAYNLIVRIETESGEVGWGEAASAPTMTGDTLSGMVAAVRSILTPFLVGKDARFTADLAAFMRHIIYGNTGARAAIEMALIDLIGRAGKITAVELLGGKCRDSVAPMWLLGNAKVEADVAEARKKYDEGYRFFKLKVGVKPIDGDIRATHELRQRLPDDVILCADANMGFNRESAQCYLDAIKDSGLYFLEQPLPHEDLDGLAILVKSTKIPLCADEGIHSNGDLVRHFQRGVRGASLKFIKLGGVIALMDAARVCSEYDRSVNVAGKIAESGISSAANIHASCAIKEAAWGTSLTHVYLADDLVVTPMTIENGRITLTEGPGLGIDVSEDKVRTFTMKEWAHV